MGEEPTKKELTVFAPRKKKIFLEYPKEFFVEEATKLVKLADERGIPLRILGALAIYIHSPEEGRKLHDKFGRKFSDIDLITTGKREDVKEFFTGIGYIPRERMMVIMEEARHIYLHPEKQDLHVDIFFDELNMCHRIDFRKRISVDYPTISLADLVLEKLQIVHINEKDIMDLITLFRYHEVGESDKDEVNAKYIAKLLANDWGFWYTATNNLRRLRDEFLEKYSPDVLTEEDVKVVKEKVDALMDYVEKEPKSMKWKLRAKIGPKVKWYQEVDEIW